MRAARILKYLSDGIVVLGIYRAFSSIGEGAIKFLATIFLSLILWCFLRVIANIGQIIFDLQGEAVRVLGNIERSSYRFNASLNEIKDLIASGEADKKQ